MFIEIISPLLKIYENASFHVLSADVPVETECTDLSFTVQAEERPLLYPEPPAEQCIYKIPFFSAVNEYVSVVLVDLLYLVSSYIISNAPLKGTKVSSPLR